MGEPFLFAQPLYRFRFVRAYIKPEPNQISLAFVSLETPVAEEKKKYGSHCGGADFFLTLLSLSYEKFVVTLRMATLSKILVLCVGFALSNNLWAQSREFGCRNVDGVWQEKTDIVNSAFLARYTINADSIWYSVNEYDGLNPIRSFGGTYTIDRDSISIRIQYIKRVSHTAICRDQFLPANNQWSILDEGKLVTDTLPAPQLFVLPIKIETKTLVIDDIPFYLIADEQQ